MSKRSLVLVAAALAAISLAGTARAASFTEADFGGDYDGNAFSETIFTDLGTLPGGMVSTISGTTEDGLPSDAIVFSTTSAITSLSIEFFTGVPVGSGVGVAAGTGTDVFPSIFGSPDLFSAFDVAVP